LPNFFLIGIFVELILLVYRGVYSSAWNPRKAEFDAFLTPAGILLEGVVKDTNLKVKLINCYGSYADRVVFWEELKRIGIFDEENLILGGDLNFTISSREVWGDVARVDPLQHYFSHLVQTGGLVDVEPVKILLTWRNGRKGQDYIAKRLDRFLISEKLVSSGIRYRSWICNDKISDHMPVMLQLEFGSDIVSYPFKFNAVWMEDQDFVSFVRNSWADLLGTEVLTPMESLVKKLKRLKSMVIVWERKKKVEGKKELVQLESELDKLYSEFPGGFVEEKDKLSVLDKEQRKRTLLKQEEETWRQKSRVNWLAAGDRNTKKIHAYANSRKQINTIWDITKGDGTTISNNFDLQKEVVDYFQNMFKAQGNLGYYRSTCSIKELSEDVF
jgi:hypothetical protein